MLLQRNPQLSRCIPPNTPHSMIHSIPTWQDNVDLCMGRGAAVNILETTYPRFYIHPFLQQVIEIVLGSHDASPEQTCLLFPSLRIAKAFRSHMHLQFPSSFPEDGEIHSVAELLSAPPLGCTIFAVLFNLDQKGLAMNFWTFSGNGISSRLAENCLRRLNGQMEMTLGLPTEPDHEYASYYSSHSPITSVSEAKERIKTRFAGISADGTSNIRGVARLSTNDVYIYSTGMSAIWHVHQMLHDVFGGKFDDHGRPFIAAHVNMLYVDSYKLLEATTSRHHFFTNDTLDDLELFLNGSASSDTAVLAIFTDFPGNPHLRSADLPRLRMLGDKYHIPIIIDETVGCHLNVAVLPYADVVVASLSKVFSGYANVLGGALLLNPSSEFYARFKAHLNGNYEDNYFDADALVMEINSRGVEDRLAKINKNTEALADWLFSRSKAGAMNNSVIQEVFYPKYQSHEKYERCIRTVTATEGNGSDSNIEQVFRPGYGGLLSLSFTSLDAAKTFYESIQCYKGATLGTLVTLLTAFVVAAFPPQKMDWVREHDVAEALVRFSVGVEDISRIVNSVEAALFAAEKSR
ncbi:PLP-dependent transferase [Gymnopus androsaceus JB14]|uniref:PLP-dependent transferase n=1 Tax=Gymnopus androsaceus JB14 TaxID=1447944 RepID=A0A6A4HHR3_9AGAR|nr:PLP-dependent transferase [Gymnopus androsaceus JB14]